MFHFHIVVLLDLYLPPFWDVFPTSAQLRCVEREFLHHLGGICLSEGVSRPGIWGARTAHVGRMDDILMLLLAHRKPLSFLEIFYTHSIVHLKLHMDGDMNVSPPWGQLGRCMIRHEDQVRWRWMKLRTVRATLKSCLWRSVHEGWPRSLATAFRFLFVFSLAQGGNSYHNPLDYVIIKPL